MASLNSLYVASIAVTSEGKYKNSLIFHVQHYMHLQCLRL